MIEFLEALQRWHSDPLTCEKPSVQLAEPICEITASSLPTGEYGLAQLEVIRIADLYLSDEFGIGRRDENSEMMHEWVNGLGGLRTRAIVFQAVKTNCKNCHGKFTMSELSREWLASRQEKTYLFRLTPRHTGRSTFTISCTFSRYEWIPMHNTKSEPMRTSSEMRSLPSGVL